MRRPERRRRRKAHRRAERNRADQATARMWATPPVSTTIRAMGSFRFDVEEIARLVAPARWAEGRDVASVTSRPDFGVSPLREAYRRWSLMTSLLGLDTILDEDGLYWALLNNPDLMQNP